MNSEICDTKVQPTVFVVDDDQAIRSGIAELIEAVHLRAQTFISADEFVNMYDPAVPGCVVVDLQMPGMSGLELQANFSERGISIPVIMITGHGDTAAAVQSMKLGAIDFIEKPFRERILLESIRKAIAYDANIRGHNAKREQFHAKLSHLTSREREILESITSGKTDKQIAFEYNVSPRAVSFHRLHILEKMQVSSVVDLTRFMVNFGSLKY